MKSCVYFRFIVYRLQLPHISFKVLMTMTYSILCVDSSYNELCNHRAFDWPKGEVNLSQIVKSIMLRSAVRGWNHKYTKKYSLRVGTINTQRHIHRVMGWDQIVKYPPKGIVKPVLDQCVKIRTASLSDYNSVVSIIQNGEKKTFDHLADKYCAYISSPTSTGYIANINGEDVGVLLTHLIDDGSNVVLDEFRSQEGTDEKAKGVVIRHVFDNLNSKTRTATQSSHGGTQTKLIQVSGQECRKVATKIRGKYYSSVPDLLVQLRSNGVQLQSAARLTKNNLIKMIKNQNLPQTQSNGKILKAGILYRPILQNVDLLMDKRTLLLTTNMKNTELALMSFGTYSYTTNGLHCNLSFHGNMHYGLDEHLFLHLISLLNRGIGLISFEIYSESHEDNHLIEKTVKNFNVHAAETDTVTWWESRLL